ncbi:prosaposin [Hylaeus volcanicus]|uniref:prosaposin n=1 Tax=Hylaeus volcanicus TaxID=313075 RepID=UPI0023B87EA5|nr:prosaposin [Hylaeus volcanicus]
MQILLALSAIIAVSTARVVITAEGPTDLHLLGQEECTWGPSYWCENIKTAAGCNATKHCIKTIWNSMKVPEDSDDVCTVCKDMVQQARDQLESNQTQSDLKAVFEGSCRLMRIKTVVNECIKIVDQFIPDLVETLASQMNPSVVCSVAGLCNSAHIDKLLEESSIKVAEMKTHSLEDDEIEPDECTKCYTVATHMEHRLKHTPRDKMLQQMLNSCAEFNTFTDACSAIILTNFETIYTHLQENFNAQNICHLSGQCSGKFHKHEDAHKTPEVEIRPLSSVGMVEVGDDLPCKLCEQLVGHLRDLLVANTTEAEFRLVLDGLCKQTKSFSSECTAIVDEYYPEIYEYLTKRLNSNAVCQMSGICPEPGKEMQDAPIWPLLPNNVAEVGVRMLKDSKKKFENDKHQELSEAEVESMQLPIERMLPFPISEGPLTVHGKGSCALCEYVLHYIQDSITTPVTEDKIKHAIQRVCTKLPGTVRGECSEFVDTYGDAILAILAQEIDPSQACPMLHFCPSQQLMNMWESVPSKYMLEEQKNKKPSCPLCLLAVSQVYNIIKNNKTEANIESVLDKLCIHLPRSLSEECTDLVKGYSKELVDLLLADLSPQEVCVYIKLCDDNKNTGPRNLFITDNSGEILIEEVPDTFESTDISEDTNLGPTCVVCEYAMRFIEKKLGSEKAKNKVEDAVRGVCKHLPKHLSNDCNKFVNKHGDTVIDVIVKGMSPKTVCTLSGLCVLYEEEFKASVVECATCKGVISVINELLANPKVDDTIINVVSKACKHVPASKQSKCATLVNIYGQSIINLIEQHTDSKKICGKIGVCASEDYSSISLESARSKRSYEKDDIKRCTWGPVYWCSSNETALKCKAVEHCKENVWKAEFAPPKQITFSAAEPNA